LVRGNVCGGFWLIVIGAWFEAAHLRLWGITLESSWPLILVAVGGAMIVRAIVDAQRRREAAPPEGRHG
ncbi:MAG TPA: hypothetical protein VLU46_00090, partial [Thermoanaerobaculia bacterium]|nr:hypothetical protein [Thermoanaerobaculia bacterium]